MNNIESDDLYNQNKAIAKAISPFTEQLLSINGEIIANSLPQKVKNWIADTAILAAEFNRGTIFDDEIPPENTSNPHNISEVPQEDNARKVTQIVFQ